MYTGEEITTSQLGHVTVTTTTKNVPKKTTRSSKSELFICSIISDSITSNCILKRPPVSWSTVPFWQKSVMTSQPRLWWSSITRYIKSTWSTPVELGSNERSHWQNLHVFLYVTNLISKVILLLLLLQLQLSFIPVPVGGGSKGWGKPKKQAYFQYQSPLPKVAPVATVQCFVSVPPAIPHFPGQFAHPAPRFRPPLPPHPPPPRAFQQQHHPGGKKGKKANAEAKKQAALLKNPNIVNERCSSHNFSGKGCSFGPNCLRLHVCFNCGDPLTGHSSAPTPAIPREIQFLIYEGIYPCCSCWSI